MVFRTIGVLGKDGGSGLDEAFARLRAVADKTGARVLSGEGIPGGGAQLAEEVDSLDLLVSLGGDGSLLRAARLVMGKDVPVLGINLGNLGFLTSISGEDLAEGLSKVLSGEYSLERRRTLHASVVGPDGSVRRDVAALNDVVVHKSGVARVTNLDLWVRIGGQEEEIGSFSGDGVVLSTPTGSTAYSLSAGGPIIVPELPCFLVTPICPHTLAVRPLVVPGDGEISVQAFERGEPLVLTVDGQEGYPLAEGDRVVVGMSDQTVPLVRLPGHSFFATLRQKLNWAVRPGS